MSLLLLMSMQWMARDPPYEDGFRTDGFARAMAGERAPAG
jgi:hypothetical protein